jgi:hypothetical protein
MMKIELVFFKNCFILSIDNEKNRQLVQLLEIDSVEKINIERDGFYFGSQW